MKATHLLLLAAMTLPASAEDPAQPTTKTETAVVGGGCFWCVEGQYEMLKGVKAVTSGYAGGSKKNPTYKDVCTGTTGHAEVVKIDFDPTVISYREIVDLFWEAHDPTTLNQQGPDHGTQYRSIILFSSDAQKQSAEASKAEAQKKFKSPITTEIVPLDDFYPAEDYHQDFARNNPYQGYIQAVSKPKIEKFRHKLEEEGKKAENK